MTGIGFFKKFIASVKHEKPKTATAAHFQQNIATADFNAPVLFAGVYEYTAAELGFEGGGNVRVYYSPEEIAKKDFIQSIFYSALSVGTHEKNTNENNADPDGWIREANYKPEFKGAFCSGVIYRQKNVDYVAQNEKGNKFGTSAYFRATYNPQPGVSPEGEAYDLLGTDLVCNHLAILENPRDDKNVVVITKINRAVAQHAKIVTRTNKNSHGGIIKMADTEEKPAVDKEAVRNALEDIKNEDAQKNEIADLKNQVAKMSEELKGLKPAETANAAIADEDKDKKDGEAANAAHGLPSQEIVKAFAKHYGRDFGRTTPTFAALADIAEISGDTVAAKARAVVAHAKTLENETPETGAQVAHESGQGISFSGFAKAI